MTATISTQSEYDAFYCCTHCDQLLPWYRYSLSVCLSVSLSVCDAVHCGKTILQQKSLNKWIGSADLGTRFYNFQPLHRSIYYPLKLLTSWTVDVAAIWRMHSEHSVNKQTAKISTSGIAIVSMLHGYTRHRRTIGSFSATAGLLVSYSTRNAKTVQDIFFVFFTICTKWERRSSAVAVTADRTECSGSLQSAKNSLLRDFCFSAIHICDRISSRSVNKYRLGNIRQRQRYQSVLNAQ